VTGSVNQRGRVQAVGGVNEKIEGFFDVCQAGAEPTDRGLLFPWPTSGISWWGKRRWRRWRPAASRSMRSARSMKRWRCSPGWSLGNGTSRGISEGSVNRRVEDRLIEFSRLRQAFAKETEAGGGQRLGGG